MKCLVKNCRNRPAKRKKGISYHRFPKCDQLKEQWLISIGLGKNYIANPSSIICSVHFGEDCFMPNRKELQKRHLKKSAVPKLFIAKPDELECDENDIENTCPSLNIVQTTNLYPITEESMVCSSLDPTKFQTEHIYKNSTNDFSNIIGANVEVPFYVENLNNSTNILDDASIGSLRLIRNNEDHDYTSFIYSNVVNCGHLPPINEISELSATASNTNLSNMDFSNSKNLNFNVSDLNKSPSQLQNIFKIPKSSPFGSGSSIGSGSSDSFVSKILKSSDIPKKFNKITLKRAMTSSEADLSTTPRTELRTQKLRFLRCKYNKLDKKNKSLQRKSLRQKEKINNLGQLLSELEEKNLITSCQKDKFLDHTDPNAIFINRYSDKVSNQKLSRKYPEVIRKFALNLNFYSPRAYEYVRKQFRNCLPHSRTLANWYKVVNGFPGFTAESFRTLELMVRSKREKGEVVVGNVCLDEMYIHPKYEYDFTTKKIWGFVEFEGSDPNDKTLATQVIVFMFVCCTGRWKIALGYFPINSLTSHQKRNMIESCLRLLNDIGVVTIGVTFDGLATNFTIARELGCNVSFPNINLTFKLSGISRQFLIFFDPCHMFKLIRNIFANNGPLVDSEGNTISWRYLEELHRIQSNEGFHLANKLRKAHIYFKNQKMKVNLAVQTLSNSVANALEFCDSVLKLPQFTGCNGTIKFIRVLNNTFDILNSKSFQDYGFKKPISKSNFNFVLKNIQSSMEYLAELKFLSDGSKIIHSKRKTGFIGIIGCLSNIQFLYDDYVSTNMLKYISYYKLSQDHIELFFSVVRSRLGRNTNPTLKQFIATYKRILTHVQLGEALLGNCIPQDEISILNVSNFNSDNLINSSINRFAMVASPEDISIVHENPEKDQPLYENDFLGYPIILSEFSINVIEYIGGFIVRYLFRKLHCEDCCKLIHQSNNHLSLINLKNRGGLSTPSSSVLKICKYTEEALKRELVIVDYKNITLQSNSNFFKKICHNVLQNLIDENIFCDENQYSHSHEHENLLAQSIIEKYYDIRMNYFCNEKSVKLTKRNRFVSLLHFAGM